MQPIKKSHGMDREFRRVVRMRFDMFTLAYTTNTPIFSGNRFDVKTRLTVEDYEKAAQVVKLMISERPPSPNPELGILRNIVENCASTATRCSD